MERKDKLGDVVEYLRKKAVFGAPRFATWETLRITATKVFRVVYGNRWQDMPVDGIDVDQLFDEFTKRYDGDCRKNTYRMYYSRLNRAFAEYRAYRQHGGGDLHDDEAYNDAVRRLSLSTRTMHNMFLEMYGRDIFTRDTLTKCDSYVVPIGTDGFVAVAIPKNLTMEDIYRARDVANGIFACEVLKRKEEV